MQLFNSLESISIGLFKVPNQFDNSNTKEQFTNAIETAQIKFDCLLFMSKEASFSDLGFKEITISNKSKTTTHFRNSLIGFENFKEVFKHKSLVLMKTAFASGNDRAIEAVQATYELPDFYLSQILEIKNTIAVVATGNIEWKKDEINQIGLYCLDQNKRGASLCLSTMEDLSLKDKITATTLISDFGIQE
jgi:cell division GTPase FtsZ